MNDAARPLSVLFVCLGNICRSPTAHGVFRDRIVASDLADRVLVDSAGTGDWHLGKAPDRRAVAAAAARGIRLDDLRARQVTAADLERFDYVLAMDDDNLASLQAMARSGSPRARIDRFAAFSAAYPNEPVPDPYFGGVDGFEGVLDRIEDACDGLEAAIRERLSRPS